MNISLNSLLRARGLHLFKGVAVIVEHHLVCVKEKPLRVHDQNMLRKEIYELPELPLVLPKTLLGSLALLYIRHQVIPTDNATFGVTLWTSSCVQPAIHSIGSTNPILKIKRVPTFHRAPPP